MTRALGTCLLECFTLCMENIYIAVVIKYTHIFTSSKLDSELQSLVWYQNEMSFFGENAFSMDST